MTAEFVLFTPDLPSEKPRGKKAARRRLFYFVEVHDNETAMNRSLAKLQGRTLAEVKKDAIVAACLRYEYHPLKSDAAQDNYLSREVEPIGTLFFNKTTMTEEVVAHELAHAAIGWCRRIKVDPTDNRPKKALAGLDQEELFASCVQKLHRRFWEEYQGR